MSRRSDVSLKNSVRRGQEGNAMVKFLAVVVVLFLVAFGGFNYIITWYQCAEIQSSVKESIDRANMSAIATDRDPEKIKQFIRKKGNEYEMPQNAVIKVERGNTGVTAQVAFTREVAILPMNLYKYKYEFNQVAGPAQGFLTK